jgi:hypothetical protein
MASEFSSIDPDRMVSPHAQEVEYALILSRMIDTVKDDPVQLRLTIYEFVRARLQIDTSWADADERQRLSAALETAIQGVEKFSAHSEQRERLRPPIKPAQIAAPLPADESPPTSLQLVNPASDNVFVPRGAYSRSSRIQPILPILDVRAQSWVSMLARFSIGMLLFAAVVSLAIYNERVGLNLPSGVTSLFIRPKLRPPVDIPEQVFPQAAVNTAAIQLPAFPLPNDYGVYALSNAALSELHPLQEQVPDKRVAMSTPINQQSRTILADGKAKFVVFRRDLAGNAPDRIDVRVVARVVRALTFDAKGKPGFSPVSDAWNIRNLSYEFRVRPIAGNPEMLLVQPERADFVLPAGRYVLALKNQGYDFTIAGKVTDPAQCLERTDAANGMFYSECQKQ